jgi:hypothetical protein
MEAAMNTPEPAPLFQIPCRNLRSKEMYYQGLGQPEDEFSSGLHWCAKTQEGFGPDGQPAGKIECCCLERPCYIG